MSGLEETIIVNASSYQNKLSLFFDELSFRNKIFYQFKSQADKFLSTDFNVFDIINPDENKLSDILSKLFDVRGVHGQKNLFADIFIQFLNDQGLTVPHCQYNVLREYSANGRIDVLLESGDFALIIENKPFAYDQKDQINRYYEAMCQKHPNSVAVIYLNKTYNKPQNFSDELKKKQLIDLLNSKKLLILSYATLIDYLTECYQQCESIKFRYFLADFMDYIRITFPMTKGEING